MFKCAHHIHTIYLWNPNLYLLYNTRVWTLDAPDFKLFNYILYFFTAFAIGHSSLNISLGLIQQIIGVLQNASIVCTTAVLLHTEHMNILPWAPHPTCIPTYTPHPTIMWGPRVSPHHNLHRKDVVFFFVQTHISHSSSICQFYAINSLQVNPY